MSVPGVDIKAVLDYIRKNGFTFVLAVIFIAQSLGYVSFPWENIFAKLTAIAADVTTVLENQKDSTKLLRGICQNVAKDDAGFQRCN